MLPEIGHAQNCRPGIRRIDIRQLDAGMVFKGAHRGHENYNAGLQIAVGGDDVKIFFRSQVKTKTCFRDDIIGQPQSQVGADNAVGPLCYIGKRSAMNDGRYAFRRLNKVRKQGIFQECCDGAFDF